MNNDTPDPAMQDANGKRITIHTLGNSRPGEKGKGRPFLDDMERQFQAAAKAHDDFLRENPGVQDAKTELTLKITWKNEGNPHTEGADTTSVSSATQVEPKFSLKVMPPRPANYLVYSTTADSEDLAKYEEADKETGEVKSAQIARIARIG